jgi:O-antigen/teichoic acid export membrane protein
MRIGDAIAFRPGPSGVRDRMALVPGSSGTKENKPIALVIMARNALANLVRMGTSWIILLFLPPLLVRCLDKSVYGVWMLLLQAAAYVTVFDAGVQTAIARFVARSEGQGDRRSTAELLSSAGAILLFATSCAILFTILTASELAYLFHEIPSTILRDAQRALIIIGLCVSLALPFSTIAGFFSGLQKNEINALAVSVGKFAAALGVGWAAYHRQGIIAMAIWLGLGYVIQVLIYVATWSRQSLQQLVSISLVRWKVIREFLSFCSATFVSQFSAIIVSGLDIPVVVAFDFRATAYYAVAATLSNALIVPHGAIVSTLMPVAAGMHSGESAHRMGELLQKTTRVATVVLCLITLPLMLGMSLFLRIWVGADYAVHSVLLAEILIVAQFIRLTMLPYAMVGYAAGQLNQMLYAPIGEGIVNLAASLALVRVFGAPGVALGTLLGAAVSVGAHFFISIPRTDCVVVNRKELAWNGILSPVLISISVYLPALALIRLTSSLATHAFLVGCSVLFSGFLLWSYGLRTGDREQLKGLFNHGLGVSSRLLPALRPQ